MTPCAAHGHARLARQRDGSARASPRRSVASAALARRVARAAAAFARRAATHVGPASSYASTGVLDNLSGLSDDDVRTLTASLDGISSVPDADPAPDIDPLGASLDDHVSGRQLMRSRIHSRSRSRLRCASRLPLAAQRRAATPDSTQRPLVQALQRRVLEVVQRTLGATDEQMRQLVDVNRKYEGERRALNQRDREARQTIRGRGAARFAGGPGQGVADARSARGRAAAAARCLRTRAARSRALPHAGAAREVRDAAGGAAQEGRAAAAAAAGAAGSTPRERRRLRADAAYGGYDRVS